MSKLNLNNMQKMFVENTSGNMLVSASAGSGKTTTMIAKLVNLIVYENTPVKNLLVVTFTEASAQDMKQKLYFGLIDEINSQKFSDEKLDYLYSQVDDVMMADIGTLHSICKKIVTKYFYEINIEPNFKVISEEEYLSLFNMALQNVFDSYIENGDEEFYYIFESFNDKRNTTKLKNIITQIYNFLSEKVQEEAWFYDVLNKTTTNDFENNACIKFLLNFYDKSFKSFYFKLNELKTIIEKEEPKLINYIYEVLNIVKNLINISSYNLMLKTINNDIKFPTLRNPKSNEKLFENLKETVKELKATIKLAMDDFCEDLNKFNEKIKRVYIKLFEIVNCVKNEFLKIKQNYGYVDFSDLQKFALKILENVNICNEIKLNYKYVFVDEYQDINQIQEEIILKITSNNNLYMIGDVKQSIYAFRQCKPEIFLSKYKNFKLDGVNNKLLLLNENYRSSKQVINFANFVFNEIIRTDTIGIDYLNDANLICGSNANGEVKITVINNSNGLDQEKISNECHEVANQISQLLGKPYLGLKDNITKNIEYKDIAILVRDATDFVFELYSTLTNYGIPVTAQLKQSLSNSLEVKVLFSLLKFLSNNTLEVELATLLLSPIVNLNNNDLIKIKLESNYNNFYESVLNYNSFGTDTYVSDKLVKFNKEIDEIKLMLKNKSIYEVLQYVILKYDLLNYYYSLPYGNKRVNNINQFLNLVNNEIFKYNLHNCIKFLNDALGNDNFKISLEGGENSVKILTMHKSKGLEFPAVILCNLGKNFNKTARASELIITDELGLGLNYKDVESRKIYSTIQKNANVILKLNTELEEQIRLLYVAITRAKNYLNLIGTYNLDKVINNKNKNIYVANNFLDLVFKSFKNENLNNLINKVPNFSLVDKDSNNLSEVKILEANDISKTLQSVEAKFDLNVFDNNLQNLILTKLNKPKIESKNIATKNSVSGILRDDEDYVNNAESGLSLDIEFLEEKNSALVLGTVYHKIMQSLNFSESLEEIKNVIKNLKFKEIEFEDALKKVDANLIYNAVNKIKTLITNETKILKEEQFLLKIPYNKIKQDSNIETPVLIQGVVDLILINGNSAIIIDFKTNKTSNTKQLIKKYKLQLDCYAIAVKEGKNINVSDKYLYLFNTNELVKV